MEKKLHTNDILWNNLNKRNFQTLFNEFENLYNICKSLSEQRESSLYLKVYNLLIYSLFDLIHYCGFQYICEIYGEDFADNERFNYIPKHHIIFDHIVGKYMTFVEWESFCKDFAKRCYIYGYNINDFSEIDLKVCIEAFFEIPLPTKK